jgi:hypothetical protein
MTWFGITVLKIMEVLSSVTLFQITQYLLLDKGQIFYFQVMI